TQSTSTVLDDRFVLKARLFSEGNQAAYAARDRARGEDVLLFLIPASGKLAEKVEADVRADIAKAFQVEAPNLLPLLDMGDSGGYRFLVMPKPVGRNAWERITQKKGGARLDPAQAITAGDGLVAAAKAAHAKDTILGFSPKQVWIDAHGDVDVQYYWLERVHLAAGGGFKTLAAEGGYFQAPELDQGQAGAKPPADQFFIAAILYGLLTGEVPGGTLAPIRRTRKDVPKPLASAIEKGLARDPTKRHASLDAFRQALHRRRARLGYLVPMLLLLLGLWAGASVLLGGASLDDWQFPAETEARRQASFEASKPTPQPVPRADADTLARYAGRYESGEGATPDVQLELGRDGAFHLTDRRGDAPRIVRGLYHAGDGGQAALVLRPVGQSEEQARPLNVTRQQGGLTLALDGGAAVTLAKVAWPRAAGEPFQPLVTLEQPSANAVLAETKIRVVGRVAVPETKVTVGGADVPVVGTRFDSVFDAPARGDVELVIVATAPDGMQRTVRHTVRVDTGAPRIEAMAILAQESGVWQLRVEGRAADDGKVATLSVNDELVELDEEGRFAFARRGADALQFAFAEIVAVDDAGRAARRLLWPAVDAVDAEDLAPRFAALDKALEAKRNAQAEDLLRAIRREGGLIEQLPPERLTQLVHSDRPPSITFEDYPAPPAYFPNDGTQQITLSGSVAALAPDDTLTIAGRAAEIEGGRFTLRFPLPKLGPNTVTVRVLRGGKAVAERDLDVWLAAEDGPVPTWTGVPVSDAQRRASARYGLPLGIQDRHGLRFVLVPPGAFFRETQTGRRFEVRVTEPYYLQVREVGRELYERITGSKLPAVWKARGGNLPVAGSDRPATGMSREEALAFAERLGAGGAERYALPTEAQWELAARAGREGLGDWWLGNPDRVPRIANFADASIRDVLPRWPESRLTLRNRDKYAGTWPLDAGEPNAFGLRNLFGNAGEWVRDLYAEYDPQDAEDPDGPEVGKDGIVRGGSFRDRYDEWGFGTRARAAGGGASASVGFRLVLRPEGR
ncbi:MAG: SUMF1/EgtB/PvdO family nonheme iron enzyme, partial [Planctomycetota bacterium]|nr:SUMF1/EgtB/PvdO family nonheme iron enzyme [Planctomycetota bacterium]